MDIEGVGFVIGLIGAVVLKSSMNLMNEPSMHQGLEQSMGRERENPALKANESNRAFVLMQFFGYLRRNPNDAQDTDYTGYDFWLQKLDQFHGDFVRAEMVKAFITSVEYRQRFGQP